jgi:hypothetical protein
MIKTVDSELARLQAGETFSVEEKLTLAYELACHVGYVDGHMTVRDGEYDYKDDVWMFVDGLYHKWFYKHLNGECSLQASLDCDMEKVENELDGYISNFEKVYKDFK